jgi:hypothetical protein
VPVQAVEVEVEEVEAVEVVEAAEILPQQNL